MGAPTGIRVTKELRVSPSDLAELIVSLGGVKFWIVAVFPLYIGWVLAQPLGGRHLFIDDLRVMLGVLVVGPFLGTFTLLLNVYYDMDTTDRANPRKTYVRVVEELIGEGLMDRGTILIAALGFAALGLMFAAYTSLTLVDYGGSTSLLGPWAFAGLMVATTSLSVAYSHPAVRWKGVAGADLLTNLVGFGVVCPLGGWALLRPIEEAPWWFIATIALFLGALYAPTTASDVDADRAYGIRTLAVRLGVTATLRLGFLLEVASVALLAVGWSQGWFPFDGAAHDAMGPLWPSLGLALVFYLALLRSPTTGRIWALLLLLSLAQGLGLLLLLWAFVGGRTVAA
ncbi:MAG TPA: UbiA family prenyltransferase [Thermoplasmata archaeon]|nr:UbiA family prenyltransferase [Thermoplasmata archaeon]